MMVGAGVGAVRTPVTPSVPPTVALPVADSVVKAPVLGVVLPIGPGAANRLVNPTPETVLVADSVVNAPVLAVVLPIGPGAANRVVNPAPETAPVADSVVNAPVLAVVAPIAVELTPVEVIVATSVPPITCTCEDPVKDTRFIRAVGPTESP